MEESARQKQREQELLFQHSDIAGMEEGQAAENPALDGKAEAVRPFVREGVKVGRNDPCPCGSGKKYKQCHGKLD